MPYAAINDYIDQAQYTQVNDDTIAHWCKGQGETIVLIHGFPSASWDWHPIWEDLTQRYRVVAIDLLGFGLSNKPHKHAYSVIEQANIVEHILGQVYQVQHCDVLAHDYGVSVAQELLCRSNANSASLNNTGLRFTSVCFLNGGLFAESHRPLIAQKLLKSPIGGLISKFMSKRTLHKSFTKIFGRNTPPSEQDINALWQLIMHNNGRAALPKLLAYIDERGQHRDRWVSNMQNTNTALFFINGVQDPISGKHMLEQFNHLIPKGESTGLDVGHYPQLEAPEQVLALYLEFVNRQHVC